MYQINCRHRLLDAMTGYKNQLIQERTYFLPDGGALRRSFLSGPEGGNLRPQSLYPAELEQGDGR